MMKNILGKSKTVNIVNARISSIKKPFSIITAILIIAFTSNSVFACGGVFDVGCNLSHGGMSPQNLGKQAEKAGQDVGHTLEKAGQDAGHVLSEAGVATAGAALEQSIIMSHNTAVNGSMPIPQEIRQLLTNYASEDSMNRVRYKIGDNGFVNMAHLLEQGGYADAVTLIDVVVFRGPTEAGNPSIWAHELTHVDQYQNWGVHSFAVQYVRNYRGVEDPAYAKGNGFWPWYQQQNQRQGINQIGGAGLPQQFPMPQLPQQVGAFCYTSAGRFGPGPAQPQGAFCVVGNLQGQIGP